ncbi:hypothetical protein [Candidatus Bealeia paramacronuclearis]|uniref:hypothetical protein n=1 Tax=Candidatus Bealeia paramacronuclearis TaxID=1921001 RepID=UPI002F266230
MISFFLSVLAAPHVYAENFNVYLDPVTCGTTTDCKLGIVIGEGVTFYDTSFDGAQLSVSLDESFNQSTGYPYGYTNGQTVCSGTYQNIKANAILTCTCGHQSPCTSEKKHRDHKK